MLITTHWSATTPDRQNDYHVEFGLNQPIPVSLISNLAKATSADYVDFDQLKSYFNVWKNTDFSDPTDYGSWHLNHDPRDRSSNIEIGALCMGGEGVQVAGPWGKFPFTWAHFWMHVGVAARVALLKNIDTEGSFDAAPYNMQNGPIWTISTHAERALQQPDTDATIRPNFGYFIFSGDPDSRWDITVPDVSLAGPLNDANIAAAAARQWAHNLRIYVKEVKIAGVTDYWGLDK